MTRDRVRNTLLIVLLVLALVAFAYFGIILRAPRNEMKQTAILAINPSGDQVDMTLIVLREPESPSYSTALTSSTSSANTDSATSKAAGSASRTKAQKEGRRTPELEGTLFAATHLFILVLGDSLFGPSVRLRRRRQLGRRRLGRR